MKGDQVLRTNDEILNVENVGDGDVAALEGYYWCRVRNTWGTAVSSQTLVRVAREASKHVYSHPFYYEANVGMKLTLPCKIDDHGFPPPTVDDISWTQDDDDIHQNERIHFTHTGRFTATSLQLRPGAWSDG